MKSSLKAVKGLCIYISNKEQLHFGSVLSKTLHVVTEIHLHM